MPAARGSALRTPGSAKQLKTLKRYDWSTMTTTIKEQAHDLVDQLPDTAGWDELMEQIWIRQSVAAGMEDGRAGRTTPVEKVREKYGLPK